MHLADLWAAVGGIAAVVAAGAALTALVSVRRAAAGSQETLDAARTALREAEDARQAETFARRELVQHEHRVLRLRQLDRIVEIVTRMGAHLREPDTQGALVARIAREQHLLEAALAVFDASEGPHLPRCRKLASAPAHAVGFFVEDALDELIESSAPLKTHVPERRVVDRRLDAS